MQHDDGLRLRVPPRLQVGRVEVQVVVAEDVAEDRRRAGVRDRVRRGDEVERGQNDLVARAAADGEEREVQRRSPVGDRERVRHAKNSAKRARTRRRAGPCSTSPSRALGHGRAQLVVDADVRERHEPLELGASPVSCTKAFTNFAYHLTKPQKMP